MGPEVRPGVFTHLALTWDGITLTFYVDGTPVGEVAVGAIQTTNTFLGIGARSEEGLSDEKLELEFDGVVDEVEFFARALSGTEVRAIAGAGSAGKCKKPGLEVSCSPDPIVRGEEITCEASARSSGEAPDVRRWFFEDGGSAVEVERTLPTWSGTMVVSGTVSVVGGPIEAPDTARTEVAVSARNWNDRPPQQVTEIRCSGRGSGCPLRDPPQTFADIAQGQFRPANILRPFTRRIEEVTAGPNTGWWFLEGDDGPLVFQEYRIFLHDLLFDPSDPFWRRRSTCSPRQVSLYRSEVRRHEDVHLQRFLRLLPGTPLNQIAEDAVAFGSRQFLRDSVWRRASAIDDTIEFMTDMASPDHSRESYPALPCSVQLRQNP